MNLVQADWILAVILLLGILIGWKTGAIKVVAGIGSLIIGYTIAREYSASIAAALSSYIPALTTDKSNSVFTVLSLLIDTNAVANRAVQVIVFIILFVVVVWVIRRLAGLLDKVFRGTLVGAVNGALGAFFCLVIFMILLNVFDTTVFPFLAKNNNSAQTALNYLEDSQVVMPFIQNTLGNVTLKLPGTKV